ncbi:MAG: EamA family transporter [Candidatus Omnitrophota bacterium]
MNKQISFIIFLIVLTSICDTVNQLCLKSSINSINMHVKNVKEAFLLVWRIAFMPLAWVSLFFSGLSLTIWLYVLSKAQLSFAYAIDSMHFVFIAIASSLILKEKVGLKRWIGTLLIMLGIVLVSLSGLST